jgi:hypothetical protein
MARADLRGLIGNLGTTETAPAATPSTGATFENPPVGDRPEQRDPIGVKRVEAKPAKRRTRPDAPVMAEASPARYSDFQRKDIRLRADQQNALTEHARRLNRAKGSGGQRITDNTLIRVAIDLLLSRADKLAGSDEAELRHSVGLRERS